MSRSASTVAFSEKRDDDDDDDSSPMPLLRLVPLAASSWSSSAERGEDDEEGLVHFALAVKEGEPVQREEHFGAIGRDGVRVASLRTALAMMGDAVGCGEG